jgi:hypothetical protein
MANGVVFTNNGRKILINRGWTATPTYSVPSVFKVGTGTNTPTINDSDLQTAITISGLATKAFVAGYPIIDETNLQTTIRCLIATSECNGSSLSEFGTFNTDGTALMSSRCVFTAITKTATVQVIFVEKDRVV